MGNDAQTTWRGRWIWTRGKAGETFHFAYFRKTFDSPVAQPPTAGSDSAVIRCAADSKYRLWVNGEYVGFGPARGNPRNPYYDTHAVRLKKGRNTVAFLVEHYLGRQGIFASVRGGLICEVVANGAVLAATDRTWRCLTSRAYFPLPGRWLLPEGFDARREPEGWELPTFEDRRWEAATVLRRSKLAPPGALLPRPIPLIREKRLAPVRLLEFGSCVNAGRPPVERDTDVMASLWECKLDPKRAPAANPALRCTQPWRDRPFTVRLGARECAYFNLDFGMNTLASPEVDVVGRADVVLDLGYSECLLDDRVATQWQHPGTGQAERIILRDGRTAHRTNQPRGFRYMMLRIANPTRKSRTVRVNAVSAHEAIFPARPLGEFRSSDPLLERIYRLSARTVNLCMEDAFTDCPWRERQQWLGDLQPEALFSYYCFGAYDLAKKAVLDFAGGNTPDGWLPGVFPRSKPFNLPTWGMRFPVIAWQYALHAGDPDSIGTLYESVKREMGWLARYERSDGILVNLPAWKFVDWTWTDAERGDGAMQGWHLEALDHSVKLAAAAGDRTGRREFSRRAERLRKSLAKLYWCASRGAFLKYRPDNPERPANAPADLLGQHENFLFTLLGVGTRAQRRSALDRMRGETGRFLPDLGGYQNFFTSGQHGKIASERTVLLGSPFWSFYALLALMEAGRAREAVDYMRLGWGTMLEHGATSCWEMWDRHSSLCHGWSAAPAMILPAYVLGVRPTSPGFRRFEVHPRPADLAWAEGSVPTPHGIIRVAWKRGRRGDLTCKVTVPEGTTGRFIAEGRKPVTLPPGKHIIGAH
jgi:hypothetical protein